MSERIQGGVHEPRRHDSAVRHVSGEAAYVDDLPEPARSIPAAFKEFVPVMLRQRHDTTVFVDRRATGAVPSAAA